MNSIEKAIDILMTFVPHNQESGTTEISRKLGLHKATVSRILLTLAAKGLLQQNPQNKKFMLGGNSLKLGQAVGHHLRTNMAPLAKPLIDELRDRLMETVTLEAVYGGQSMMAYVADGPQQIRVAAEVGEILPAHASAGSKSIMAYLPSEMRVRFFGSNMRAYTPNTIVDPDEFQHHLMEVRRRGYATDLEEIDLGMCAIGVPIFNFEEKVAGSVVVVGPSVRIPGDSLEGLVGQLARTASAISARMHFAGDYDAARTGALTASATC